MEALGQYLLRLIVGTMICGIVMSIVAESGLEPWIRSLCGIILVVLMLGPVTGVNWDVDFSVLPESFRAGQHQAEAGESMAHQEQAARISQALEAYILDKAAQYGAVLSVTVVLDEDFLPIRAQLQGRTDSRTKEALSNMMEQELGIAKENQLWTG